MTLTQGGKNFICQKLGNPSECVVSAGIWWDWEDIDGNTGTEAGSTGQALSRLILTQLITKITMLTPARGDVYYTDLKNANGGNDVTLADVDEVLLHDELSNEQWCYTEPVPCLTYTDKTTCEDAGCYWYKTYFWEEESCHDKELDPMMQYLVYGGMGAAGLGLIVLLARR